MSLSSHAASCAPTLDPELDGEPLGSDDAAIVKLLGAALFSGKNDAQVLVVVPAPEEATGSKRWHR